MAVAVRIVANPISNVFQKQLAQRAADPLVTIVVTFGMLTALTLPFLAGRALDTLGVAFWANSVAAAVLGVVGYVFLWYALRSTDLSVLGPINSYKAVLGLALAVFLLGEVPNVPGLLGVALIVAGSYFVVDRAPGQRRRTVYRQFAREPGVQLRFASLICSSVESIVLKRAVILSSPVTSFLVWTIACFAIALIGAVILRRAGSGVTRLRSDWRTYSGLAISTGLMQGATLVTFGAMQVGYSLALFQLSTLVSVYFGHRFFAEGNIRRRLLGSLIMVTGAILIVTLGRRAVN